MARAEPSLIRYGWENTLGDFNINEYIFIALEYVLLQGSERGHLSNCFHIKTHSYINKYCMCDWKCHMFQIVTRAVHNLELCAYLIMKNVHG